MTIGREGSNKDIEIQNANFNFEIMSSFKYLDTGINNKNERQSEVVQRIYGGHRVYYKYRRIM